MGEERRCHALLRGLPTVRVAAQTYLVLRVQHREGTPRQEGATKAGEHPVVHPVPRMIAVLMVAPRRPHTVADQRLLMAAVPTDTQRLRTALVADAPLEAVAEAEHLRMVAAVVVTAAAEAPAVVGTLPVVAEEDTPVVEIRMAVATRI